MIQNSRVLTREDSRIPLISAGRIATQEGYPTIAERAIPVSTVEQSWIVDVGEEARAGRTTPGFVNPLVKIVRWLSHLGSVKINDSRLEARHNIHHDFRVNGIGR